MPHNTRLAVLTVAKLALKTESTKYLAFNQIPRKQTTSIRLDHITHDSAKCRMMSYQISRTHERTFKLTVGSSLCADKQGTSKIESQAYCTSIHLSRNNRVNYRRLHVILA